MKKAHEFIHDILHCETRREQAMLVIGLMTLIFTVVGVVASL